MKTSTSFATATALSDERYVELQAQAREIDRRVQTMTRAQFLAGGAVSILGAALDAWIARGRAYRRELDDELAAVTQKKNA